MDQNHPVNLIMTGLILVAMPAWTTILQDINLLFAMVASLSGAVIGVIGVLRLLRAHSKEVKNDPLG